MFGHRLRTLFAPVLRLPAWLHAAVAAASFAALGAVEARLTASYLASGHPVDYATGQLAFDARLIEGYYAVMIEAGTLGVYWRTQAIDFGFIAVVMAVSVMFGTLAARLGGAGSWGERLGLAAAVAGVAGALLDAVENLLSFVMLARPEAIPQTLALAYSSAAAGKFALLTLAMGLLALSVLAGAGSRLHRALGRR